MVVFFSTTPLRQAQFSNQVCFADGEFHVVSAPILLVYLDALEEQNS